ncbi:MAG: bacteriohopanetetrol glucosamine biosynthesis glycosyltransferase HpnI [Acidobacteriota bacterium]
MLAWVLLALVAGAIVFSALALIGAGSYRAVPRPTLVHPVPISILKPLSGLDEGLEDNLRSYFNQDYPDFEILFSARHPDDPAIPVAIALTREYPHIPTRLVLTGEPPYVNAKVYALERMLAEARHDLLVMADSDTRAPRDLLRTLAAEFEDPELGLATCPYRAVPGSDIWSRLEAIGMNTEFLAGILTARLLEGMKFGVGPCMAARRKAIEAMGGFGRFKNYLAEDFEMGRLAAELGYGNILSSAVIEHRIGTHRRSDNFEHRLRWVRSTRRSRPAGYVGQLFTYPVPLALLLAAARPAWWPIAAAALAIRAANIWATAIWILRDPAITRRWWLVPPEELLAFAFWIAGFFGNTVTWRGRRYLLNRDGTFERAGKPHEPPVS